jgi:prepilin-type N-terminal cleavage/methylation domain-containing protein
MRNFNRKRGFTLIEMLAALAAVTVLILAMGSTLIWLLRGETQSIAAHESFNRVDIIRDILHSNLRAGRSIRSPAVNATVTYPADGGTGRGTITVPFNGERVWVELQFWNGAAFEIRQTSWTWNSATGVLGNQWNTSTIGGAIPAGATVWSEPSISNFDVIRVSDRRIRFIVDTNATGEAAQSQFTVTLRNLP